MFPATELVAGDPRKTRQRPAKSSAGGSMKNKTKRDGSNGTLHLELLNQVRQKVRKDLKRPTSWHQMIKIAKRCKMVFLRHGFEVAQLGVFPRAASPLGCRQD